MKAGSSFVVRCLLAAAMAGFGTANAQIQVREIRLSATTEMTRVVLDLSAPVDAKLFTLSSPDRVVLDIPNGQLNLLSDPPAMRGLVKEFRTAARGDVLRVVLDVSGPVGARSFALGPEQQQGHRLVVDLTSIGAASGAPHVALSGSPGNVPTAATNTSTAQALISTSAATTMPTPQVKVPPPRAVKSLADVNQGRDLVVAIDAGHGGKDPGAIGRRGTQEKDVALAIARKLKARIDAEPGMRAILTRDGDYYVPHRDRMRLAHEKKADLFISVHADSVRDRGVAGSSIYVLSAGRATNEAARLLADRENAADLIGGVSLDDKDNLLASVLLDLSQNASMTASATAADHVLRQLDRVGNVLHSDVKHASLIVLTSPDIPSMLVETAFISNPGEEAKLADDRHQGRLAEALHAGVRSYFYENPPPGTQVALLKSQQSLAGKSELNTQSMVAGSLAP